MDAIVCWIVWPCVCIQLYVGLPGKHLGVFLLYSARRADGAVAVAAHCISHVMTAAMCSHSNCPNRTLCVVRAARQKHSKDIVCGQDRALCVWSELWTGQDRTGHCVWSEL